MRKTTVYPDETGNPILDLGDREGLTGRATSGPQPDQVSSPLTTLPPCWPGTGLCPKTPPTATHR